MPMYVLRAVCGTLVGNVEIESKPPTRRVFVIYIIYTLSGIYAFSGTTIECISQISTDIIT